MKVASMLRYCQLFSLVVICSVRRNKKSRYAQYYTAHTGKVRNRADKLIESGLPGYTAMRLQFRTIGTLQGQYQGGQLFQKGIEAAHFMK